jgi:hypothetical protein
VNFTSDSKRFISAIRFSKGTQKKWHAYRQRRTRSKVNVVGAATLPLLAP